MIRIGSFSSAFLPPTNEAWGKVIFLHLFVILFTRRHACPRGRACPGGMHAQEGGVHVQGHAWPGGMHSQGDVCGQGTCMAEGHACLGGCAWLGGMHGSGSICSWEGNAWLGGMHGQGVHGTHPPRPDTTRYSWSMSAGSMHPTGMHSCYLYLAQDINLYNDRDREL